MLLSGFERAVIGQPSPGPADAFGWSDLAAAHLLAANGQADRAHLTAAIVDVDRALAISPDLPAALYNRAAIVQTLGLNPVATAAWRAYLRVDPASPWSVESRRRLAAIPKNDTAQWTGLMKDLPAQTDARIAELAAGHPQEARAYGEGMALAAWGKARLAGDPAADNLLRCVRAIGAALESRFGERMLADTVAVIDRSEGAHDSGTVTVMARGQVSYYEGLLTYRGGDLAQGEHIFEASAQLLERAGVPTARMAKFRLACTVFDQGRSEEARARLAELLAAERSAPTPYYGLLALILHETAQCEAARAYWSNCIAAARESEATFLRIGERGGAAAIRATAAEAADFIGQPDVAWREGVACLKASCGAGDYFRARGILAMLCRVELRHGDWEGAAAIARLEEALLRATSSAHSTAALVRVPADPQLQADMLLRWASAEDRLGNRHTGNTLLQRAYISARSLPDPTLRAKLVSDVCAVAGAVAIRDNPQAAVQLTSVAIINQQAANRALLLPELLLTRGRAYLSLGQTAEASCDFAAGIARLEAVRTRLDDQALRPGIFEDAADLFDEAISLALRQHDTAAAFNDLERGRAQAMLEQMTDGQLRRWSLPDITNAVAPGSLLVEYAPLADRLAIFTIDGDGLQVCTVPVSRTELRQTVHSFQSGLKEKDDLNHVRRLAGKLHHLLLEPIRARIDRASQLVVVSDGLLQEVPFNALFDDRTGTFLVERKLVTSAPSAAVYATLASSRRNVDPATADRAAGKTVIFADPKLRSDLYEDFAALRGALDEARRVAARDSHVITRTAAGATAAAFQELAPGAGTVEFAGHAVIDLSEPWRSALLLASSGDDTGALTSGEIARMHFTSTQLVILSACSTLRGVQRRVDGPPSIARMFLIAGVPAVIGTSWDISDTDASVFTNALHRRLETGMAPAEALQDVQLAALHGGNAAFRHPGYWAPYSLLGLSRPR